MSHHCEETLECVGPGQFIPTLKPLPPEEIARREKQQAEYNDYARRKKVEELRAVWGAPSRHVETIAGFENEWAGKFGAIRNKLDSGFCIALVGNRGNGKTQMAVELMRIVTGKLLPAKFTTAISFFMAIKAAYRKDATQTEADVLKSFQRPNLLVIDEIGKRSDSEWENNLLFELINRRYNDLTDTLLLDNRPKSEFIQSIGPSLASRMQETGGIIECNWQSFREAKP